MLDDTDYNLTLQRAKASLAVADANRAHAAAERDRANSLLKTGGITDKDHLSAQVNLQVSEASLAQAKAEVAIAEQNVTRTRVIAPFAGRIIARLSDAGSYLASGTPIFTLVDDSVLEFRAAVPSSDFGKVKLNAPVTLTMDALPGSRGHRHGDAHRPDGPGAQPLVRADRARPRSEGAGRGPVRRAPRFTCAT